jgi:RNA polymerase sigma factor for flagellar operon FliA
MACAVTARTRLRRVSKRSRFAGVVTQLPDPPEVLERFHAALELVEVTVRHVQRSVGSLLDEDELRSFGQEGLLDAARRYDPERGVPFRAFASFRVRGAMLDGVRRNARIPRRVFARLRALDAAARHSEGVVEDLAIGPPPGQRPEDAEQALADHLAGMATAMAVGLVSPAESGAEVSMMQDRDDPEQSVARIQLRGLIERELEELSVEEATLVRRHYFEGEAFEVVARELGLSRSWASRLHSRAIGRLARRLRRNVE